MEGGAEMMTDSVVERGQSEPPPIAGCADLLSAGAAENVNKSHVDEVPQESPTTYFNEHHCGNILKVLKAQQSKAELCDTVLIVNSHHIPVHSCVIAANSPYFKALFDTSNFNRIRDQPLQISLPTTSSEVAENLIGYMYSGDISITTNCVEELLQLTEKLMMDDVRQCCELHMIKSLDLTNWSSSQVLAKTHAFPDLAGEVIKFLAQNLMIVKDTRDFPGLPASDVIQILNQSNMNEGSDLELCKLQFLLNWLSFDANNIACYEELLQCIKPTLLNTQGIAKVFEELTKPELHNHELSKRLISLVEDIEKSKEEAAKKQAEEAEAKRIAEEEAKRSVEVEASQSKENVEAKPEAKEEEEAIDGLETVLKTAEETQAEPEFVQEHEFVQESHDDNDGMKATASYEVNNADSDTEIEDNGEFYDSDIKAGSSNETIEKSSSSLGSDGHQYLEDGTLVIQPQSAWQGRGKRKSYKPKKIHSGTGRSRGRPKKQVPPLEASDDVVAQPFKRRGRPPLKRSQVLKRIKTKTLGARTKKPARAVSIKRKKEDEVDYADEAELGNEQEFPDQEDTDPSWMPIAAEDNPNEEEIEPPRRGRKRKQLSVTTTPTTPIVKEKKKRGRKPNPGDKTYCCDKCPRTFKALGALSHHMKGHGSETPMLCEICGFATRHYGSMNVHRRKHAGKVMHCPFEGCDHSEVHRARLDDHISAVHHGVKRHMCSICGKSFGAKKHLQRHEALHGKAKDIPCNLCNYMTNRTDKLREHIRRHHPIVAVDMGMLKPEDLNKARAPKPRTPKKPKEPKQPKKKKGTRYDIHSYSEVENAAEELEKKEGVETMTVQNIMVTNQAIAPSPAPVQHANQPVMVQMSHGHSMPTNMAPSVISHNAPIGVSSIPSHLLGTTTLSEEMIQYLASYSADQIHMHTQQQPPPAASSSGGLIEVQPQNHPNPGGVQHHPHHPQHPPWPGTY